MLKMFCDECGQVIDDHDAPDTGCIKICVERYWNSSDEEYFTKIFCSECVLNIGWVHELKDRLDAGI